MKTRVCLKYFVSDCGLKDPDPIPEPASSVQILSQALGLTPQSIK